ncbi:SDR family NAD(P)-dependent oxidoreductase, partial [Acinetobacter sp. RIT592]
THILINNGAISKFNKSIYDITLSEFDEVMDVNLRGSFICSQEFIKANQDESYGRIVNIASTRFNQNEAGWESYGASKGGLISLTNTMAISLSNTPITVNAISPGWIETQDYEGLSESDHKIHPSGRVGKPKDIVNTCLFLTHYENDFINGCNIIVDGGMTKKMIYD